MNILKLKIGDMKTAREFLTDKDWIIFSAGYDDIVQYLEENCFKPGTLKNREFEIAIVPLQKNGKNGIGFFFRFLDSPENREAVRIALNDYCRTPLEAKFLTASAFDIEVERLRQRIVEEIIPCLRQ